MSMSTLIGTSQAVPQRVGGISSLSNSALSRQQVSGDTVSLILTGEEAQVSVSIAGEHPQSLSDSKWFMPTTIGLLALMQLPEGWTYGGKRIHPRALEAMLETLTSILSPNAPPPTIVPTAQGGVQAEWHQNRITLEIDATPFGLLEFFYKSPIMEQEGKVDTATIADLRRFSQNLLTT